MRGHRFAIAAAIATLALGACSGDDDAVAPSPSPTTETVSPTPTWELRPVVGERTVAIYPVNNGPVLGLGSPPEIEQAAVDTVAQAIGDFLDEHLDRLQHEGQGVLGRVADDAMRASGDVAAVATALSSPENPVKAARYHIDVYHDGPPLWASARVEVVHPDDHVATATMVFTIADDGSLRLTMGGAEPGGDA